MSPSQNQLAYRYSDTHESAVASSSSWALVQLQVGDQATQHLDIITRPTQRQIA